MKSLLHTLLLAAVWTGFSPECAGQVKKVLPHYLDQEGRHTLSPSLYERDAYQALLRRHPERCSALRFDVHWKAPRGAGRELLLRLECRGSLSGPAERVVLERAVSARRMWSRWSPLLLDGETYAEFGELIAWRATLWEGPTLLSEHRSFLW